MTGLENLMFSLEIINKYMELKEIPKFKLEEFEAGNPTHLKIVEKDNEDKILSEYEVKGLIENNELVFLNAKEENLLELLQKEKQLKKEDMKVFQTILEKYL